MLFKAMAAAADARTYVKTCDALCGKASAKVGQEEARSTPDHPKTSVFFARAPPVVTQDELEELFSQFGQVQKLNLFRRWATAKTSKGCGVVHFDDHDSAAAAKNSLDGKYRWPESETFLVVEWLDTDKQNKSAGATADAKPAAGTAKSESTTEGSQVPHAAAAAKNPASQAHASEKALLHTKQQQASKSGSSSRHKRLSETWEAHEPCTAAQPAAAHPQDGWSCPMDTSAASSWMPAVDQAGAGFVPVHLLPMLSGQACGRPAAAGTDPIAGQKSSRSCPTPDALMCLQSIWSASGPLPEVAGAATSCPAADEEDWGPCTNRNSSCNTSFNSIWSNHAGRARLPSCNTLPEAPLMILQDDAWASGSSNVASGSCTNHVRSSTNGAYSAPLAGLGNSRAAACYSLFDPPICPGTEDSAATMFYSAALAFDSACSNIPAVPAAAAADSSFSHSNNALPGGLLEVIPSLDWLQLQQLQQQGQLNNANLGRQSASSPLSSMSFGSNYIDSPTGVQTLGFEQQQYGAMGVNGSAAAAAAAAIAAPPTQELVMDLMPATVSVICGCLDPIAKISKARLQINAAVSGIQLRLSGSQTEVDAAVELLKLMLQGAAASVGTPPCGPVVN